MKAKRIAVYGRVSTDAQSHASQLREVRAYVRRRWPKAEVTEYLDKASGARFSREGLDALMAQVRLGRVDVLLVYKLDRLGRSLQHLAQLVGEFETHGTALVATSQGIDTSESNPAGRLQMHVLAAVAEFERARLRKARLPSCVRRFSIKLSQLRSGIIPVLRENSQTENVGSGKNGERHAS